MYILKFTNLYKKNLKLIKKRSYDIFLLDEAIIKLQNGIKLDKKCKDYILKDEYKGFHECYIKSD